MFFDIIKRNSRKTRKENGIYFASLAISSLLILMAVVCFVYGISTAVNNDNISNRTADFTFRGSEKEIVSVLNSDKLEPYVKDYYAMKLGHYRPSNEDESENEDLSTFSWSELEESISKEVNSPEKESLLSYLSAQDRPYLISLASYNKLLKSIDEAPIILGEGEVALYSDERFSQSHDILKSVLQSNPTVKMDGKQYKLTPMLYTSNVVADRTITLSYALIVPDDIFDVFTVSYEDSYKCDLVLCRWDIKKAISRNNQESFKCYINVG